MLAALNKWPVLDRVSRPQRASSLSRVGSFIDELDEILSGPRYEPTMDQPIFYPVPNLLVLASTTQRPDQPALLKDLLANGPSVFERDLNGDTCLHVAIAVSRPEQPWVVQSLCKLLAAGADPRQRNNAGYTVYDLACDAPPELGSFRRDLLLRAILDSGHHLNDDRLLAPRRLTQYYTSTHHDLLSGGYSTQQTALFRKALAHRLRDYVDYHRLTARPQIQAAAIDRVLASDPAKWTSNPDAVFHEVLHYLTRILQGKRRLFMMIKERLPDDIWKAFTPHHLPWPQMVDQARTHAILAFDWFRPVDIEDVFLLHVDSLIERLEDLDLSSEDQRLAEGLVEVLQHSIPSYRAVSVSKSESESSSSSQATTSSGEEGSEGTNSPASTLSLRTDFQPPRVFKEGERVRQESIAKTPVEYYAAHGGGLRKVSVSVDVVTESGSEGSELGEGEVQTHKWRWATRRTKV